MVLAITLWWHSWASRSSYRPLSSRLISYATGKLDLPIVNPVNEGCTLLAVVSIFGGIMGNEYWTRESWFMGLHWNNVFIYPMVLFMAIGFVIKLNNKHFHYYQSHRSRTHNEVVCDVYSVGHSVFACGIPLRTPCHKNSREDPFLLVCLQFCQNHR